MTLAKELSLVFVYGKNSAGTDPLTGLATDDQKYYIYQSADNWDNDIFTDGKAMPAADCSLSASSRVQVPMDNTFLIVMPNAGFKATNVDFVINNPATNYASGIIMLGGNDAYDNSAYGDASYCDQLSIDARAISSALREFVESNDEANRFNKGDGFGGASYYNLTDVCDGNLTITNSPDKLKLKYISQTGGDKRLDMSGCNLNALGSEHLDIPALTLIGLGPNEIFHNIAVNDAKADAIRVYDGAVDMKNITVKDAKKCFSSSDWGHTGTITNLTINTTTANTGSLINAGNKGSYGAGGASATTTKYYANGKTSIANNKDAIFITGTYSGTGDGATKMFDYSGSGAEGPALCVDVDASLTITSNISLPSTLIVSADAQLKAEGITFSKQATGTGNNTSAPGIILLGDKPANNNLLTYDAGNTLGNLSYNTHSEDWGTSNGGKKVDMSDCTLTGLGSSAVGSLTLVGLQNNKNVFTNTTINSSVGKGLVLYGGDINMTNVTIHDANADVVSCENQHSGHIYDFECIPKATNSGNIINVAANTSTEFRLNATDINGRKCCLKNIAAADRLGIYLTGEVNMSSSTIYSVSNNAFKTPPMVVPQKKLLTFNNSFKLPTTLIVGPNAQLNAVGTSSTNKNSFTAQTTNLGDGNSKPAIVVAGDVSDGDLDDAATGGTFTKFAGTHNSSISYGVQKVTNFPDNKNVSKKVIMENWTLNALGNSSNNDTGSLTLVNLRDNNTFLNVDISESSNNGMVIYGGDVDTTNIKISGAGKNYLYSDWAHTGEMQNMYFGLTNANRQDKSIIKCGNMGPKGASSGNKNGTKFLIKNDQFETPLDDNKHGVLVDGQCYDNIKAATNSEFINCLGTTYDDVTVDHPDAFRAGTLIAGTTNEFDLGEITEAQLQALDASVNLPVNGGDSVEISVDLYRPSADGTTVTAHTLAGGQQLQLVVYKVNTPNLDIFKIGGSAVHFFAPAAGDIIVKKGETYNDEFYAKLKAKYPGSPGDGTYWNGTSSYITDWAIDGTAANGATTSAPGSDIITPTLIVPKDGLLDVSGAFEMPSTLVVAPEGQLKAYGASFGKQATGTKLGTNNNAPAIVILGDSDSGNYRLFDEFSGADVSGLDYNDDAKTYNTNNNKKVDMSGCTLNGLGDETTNMSSLTLVGLKGSNNNFENNTINNSSGTGVSVFGGDVSMSDVTVGSAANNFFASNWGHSGTITDLKLEVSSSVTKSLIKCGPELSYGDANGTEETTTKFVSGTNNVSVPNTQKSILITGTYAGSGDGLTKMFDFGTNTNIDTPSMCITNNLTINDNISLPSALIVGNDGSLVAISKTFDAQSSTLAGGDNQNNSPPCIIALNSGTGSTFANTAANLSGLAYGTNAGQKIDISGSTLNNLGGHSSVAALSIVRVNDPDVKADNVTVNNSKHDGIHIYGGTSIINGAKVSNANCKSIAVQSDHSGELNNLEIELSDAITKPVIECVAVSTAVPSTKFILNNGLGSMANDTSGVYLSGTCNASGDASTKMFNMPDNGPTTPALCVPEGKLLDITNDLSLPSTLVISSKAQLKAHNVSLSAQTSTVGNNSTRAPPAVVILGDVDGDASANFTQSVAEQISTLRYGYSLHTYSNNGGKKVDMNGCTFNALGSEAGQIDALTLVDLQDANNTFNNITINDAPMNGVEIYGGNVDMSDVTIKDASNNFINTNWAHSGKISNLTFSITKAPKNRFIECGGEGLRGAASGSDPTNSRMATTTTFDKAYIEGTYSDPDIENFKKLISLKTQTPITNQDFLELFPTFDSTSMNTTWGWGSTPEGTPVYWGDTNGTTRRRYAKVKYPGTGPGSSTTERGNLALFPNANGNPAGEWASNEWFYRDLSFCSFYTYNISNGTMTKIITTDFFMRRSPFRTNPQGGNGSEIEANTGIILMNDTQNNFYNADGTSMYDDNGNTSSTYRYFLISGNPAVSSSLTMPADTNGKVTGSFMPAGGTWAGANVQKPCLMVKSGKTLNVNDCEMKLPSPLLVLSGGSLVASNVVFSSDGSSDAKACLFIMGNSGADYTTYDKSKYQDTNYTEFNDTGLMTLGTNEGSNMLRNVICNELGDGTNSGVTAPKSALTLINLNNEQNTFDRLTCFKSKHNGIDMLCTKTVVNDVLIYNPAENGLTTTGHSGVNYLINNITICLSDATKTWISAAGDGTVQVDNAALYRDVGGEAVLVGYDDFGTASMDDTGINNNDCIKEEENSSLSINHYSVDVMVSTDVAAEKMNILKILNTSAGRQFNSGGGAYLNIHNDKISTTTKENLTGA